MEKYQTIMNLLDNTPNQQSIFRTRNLVEVTPVKRLTPIVKLNLKLRC